MKKEAETDGQERQQAAGKRVASRKYAGHVTGMTSARRSQPFGFDENIFEIINESKIL